MDLPNNADIILSHAHNLLVITIHNIIYVVWSSCGWNSNRFADFEPYNCTKMRLAAGLRPDPL